MTTWLPMESNPEVMTKYLHNLGVPKKWKLIDVFGLDPELLEYVPKPVKALILLFPCSAAYEKHRSEEDESLKSSPPSYPNDLFYMKQIIHNACGSIAIIHSIANNKDIVLEDGCLKKFLTVANDLSPEERGRILESDSEFSEYHEASAEEGQTSVDINMFVNHHFIALVNKDGEIYELDGRKSYPIKHGSTTENTFLEDSVKIIKKFMLRDPEEVRFNVIALTSAE